MALQAPSVLLVGDPRLRQVATPVEDFRDPAFQKDATQLAQTLAEFRNRHGFGRAIAAPQIGLSRRLIAANLGRGPFLMVNPEIHFRSTETFTLWDDCMSFPGFWYGSAGTRPSPSVFRTPRAGSRAGIDWEGPNRSSSSTRSITWTGCWRLIAPSIESRS